MAPPSKEMDPSVRAVLWPQSEAQGLVWALAQRAGVTRGACSERISAPSSDGYTFAYFSRWIALACEQVGLTATDVSCASDRMGEALKSCAPALLWFGSRIGVLGIVRVRGKRAACLDREGNIRWVELENITEFGIQNMLGAIGDPESYRNIVDGLELKGRRAKRALRILRDMEIQDAGFRGIWAVGSPSHVPIRQQLRDLGILRGLAIIVAIHLLSQMVVVASWAILGQSALSGIADASWIAAWGLCLLTMVPLEAGSAWMQGVISLRIGSWVKGQIFAGTLKLGPDALRGQGVGAFLSRMFESEALESLILTGGLTSVLSGLNLLVGIGLVAIGAGGAWHLLALAIWGLTAIVVFVREWRRCREWTDRRLELTSEMVEGMLGYRTRVVQSSPSTWHKDEDLKLRDYQESSLKLDNNTLWINFLPDWWMLLGTAGLIPAFVLGSASVAELALSLGAQLYLGRAMRQLNVGVRQLMMAQIAWNRVGEAFLAGFRPPQLPAVWLADGPEQAETRRTQGSSDAICEFRDVGYRYGEQERWVLREVSLRISRGDRVLLTGASGGGKSTLASLAAGLRECSTGVVFAGGLDRNALGDRQWRRKIVFAPQFHQNHIFAGTLRFNLLMGRTWPPEPDDDTLAARVCEELGLGSLLARMPRGIDERVGEMGWQLSHGERSRVFLARALLQGAELVILDESFGALDPQSVLNAMNCVFRRAPAVLAIAHP